MPVREQFPEARKVRCQVCGKASILLYTVVLSPFGSARVEAAAVCGVCAKDVSLDQRRVENLLPVERKDTEVAREVERRDAAKG